tara:strand:- start:47 stop:382 length:336 start_codon:yes stop_codon:yes gene_type:complete
MNLNQLAENYFKVWNDHKIDELKNLFSNDCSLRDWNINVSGKKDVLNANQKFFDDLPKIKAHVVNLYISDKQNTSIAELIIDINETEKIKVVDVITFNSLGLINSIRAYKG